MSYQILDAHCVVNDRIPLLASWDEKSIVVKRITDQKLICSIHVRNLDQLVDCQWDKLSVRLLCLIFKDGSIRMHQPLENGKLIAFVRTNIRNCDASIWDRISIKRTIHTEGGRVNFKQDILNLLPLLSQIPNDDSHKRRSPYVSNIDSWRLYKLDPKKSIIDIHILHECVPMEKLNIVLNAQYLMEKPIVERSANNNGGKMKKILSNRRAHYHCFYENGDLIEVNVSRLITESHILPLLETYLTIVDYNKLINNQLDIIKKTNIKTFTDFIQKTCDEAFGYTKLYDAICEKYLTGTLTDELKDWFMYTVGDRKVSQFKENINVAFKKTLQILIICTVPTLEKLILLVNKLESIIIACNLIYHNVSLESIPFIKGLLNNYQDLLKCVIKKIQIMTKESNSLHFFTLWLEDMVNLQIKDDYVRKLDMFQDSSYGFHFAQSLDILLKGKYLDGEKELVDVDTYKQVIKDCDATLSTINKSHVANILVDTIQVTVKDNFFSINFPTGFTHFEIFDMVPLQQEQTDMFLYVAKFSEEMNNKPTDEQYHVGIVNTVYSKVIEDKVIPNKDKMLHTVKFVAVHNYEDSTKTRQQLLVLALPDGVERYVEVVVQLKSPSHIITLNEVGLKKK